MTRADRGVAAGQGEPLRVRSVVAQALHSQMYKQGCRWATI